MARPSCTSVFGNSQNYQVSSKELAYGSLIGLPDEFLALSSNPELHAGIISFHASENRWTIYKPLQQTLIVYFSLG